MIRCAPSLQSLNEQRTFFGGMPPSIGNERFSVEFGWMLRDDKLGSEVRSLVRWRPAIVKRKEEVGAEVRRDSTWSSVATLVEEGIERKMTIIILVSPWHEL